MVPGLETPDPIRGKSRMNDFSFDFFGLRENPFNGNNDPRYLFLTGKITQSLAELIRGIQDHKGLLLLTGEVGSGKTTLIRQLLEWLCQNQISTAFIFNSHVDTASLFDLILAEFGIPSDPALKGNSLKALHNWLLRRERAGQTAVLIVDEAQGLPCEVLEELHLLLNLETPQQTLLQVVLVGQPELEEKLRKPQLRQLRQRISVRCKTAPLTPAETNEYVLHRLSAAGTGGEPIFESEAINAIYFYSRGIPRVINLLCDQALMSASALELRPAPVRLVEEVAFMFEFDELKPGVLSAYSRYASCASWMTESSHSPAVPARQSPAAEPDLTEQHCASMARVSAAPALTTVVISRNVPIPPLALGQQERTTSSPELPIPPVTNARFHLPPTIEENIAENLKSPSKPSSLPKANPAFRHSSDQERILDALQSIAPKYDLESPPAAVLGHLPPVYDSSCRPTAAAPPNSVAPQPRWIAVRPRRRPLRAPWWWSARQALSFRESFSAWREGFQSRMRAASAAGQRIVRESLVRWLQRPLYKGRPRRWFIHKQA
jgi:type II secretory pathway predicted ATPase ExeA